MSISSTKRLDLEIGFSQNLNPAQLCWVFESLPDICFFTKNLDGVFTQCNSATLKLFGMDHKNQLIGKNDYDIASTEIAEQYRKLDQKIIQEKKPILDQIEPVPDNKGHLSWVSTTKVPLFDHSQNVIGVAVMIRNLSDMGTLLGPYQQLNPCIEYIFQHYQETIKVEQLAKLANLSIRQLERQFKKLFKLTPLQYINEHRIAMACLKLKNTQNEISTIAKDVGFYDHSHFIRLFKQIKTMTPSHYRKSYQR